MKAGSPKTVDKRKNILEMKKPVDVIIISQKFPYSRDEFEAMKFGLRVEIIKQRLLVPTKSLDVRVWHYNIMPDFAYRFRVDRKGRIILIQTLTTDEGNNLADQTKAGIYALLQGDN